MWVTVSQRLPAKLVLAGGKLSQNQRTSLTNGYEFVCEFSTFF